MIGQWCSRNENDADWLLNQLLEMLRAGFVPGSGYSVMLWLAKLFQTHIDRVVEVLAAYFTCPWTCTRFSENSPAAKGRHSNDPGGRLQKGHPTNSRPGGRDR